MRLVEALRPPRRRHSKDLQREVARRCAGVRKHGDRALIAAAGGSREQGLPIHDRRQLRAAFRRLPPRARNSLELACRHLGTVSRRELAAIKPFDVRPGMGLTLSSQLIPLDSVGILVPVGSVETMLACAIAAAVAGVQRREVCLTGTEGAASTLLLAAAYMAEVTRVIELDGVEGAACFAYGSQTIPRVDLIVGCGDQLVEIAQEELNDHAAFSGSFGRTVHLTIADHTASPEFLAADLLAAAEADPEVDLVMLSTTEELVEQTRAEAAQLLTGLARSYPARGPWRRARALVVADLKQAARLANEQAPQRLALQVQRPERFSASLTNYGTLLTGPHTPAALLAVTGSPSVAAGPGGLAAAGPLGVHHFLRRLSRQQVDPSAYLRLARAAEALAELQERPLAADALAVRVTPLDSE